MNTNKIYPWYFSSGAILLYLLFIVAPALLGIYYSFTDWNSYSSEKNFIGLEHFRTILAGDPTYLLFIKNTVLFTVVTSIAKTVLGLFLALFAGQRCKNANWHRMIIFSPQVLSFLIVGLVFKSLLDPNNGFVNVTLRSIGLDALAQNWLGSLTWAMPSIMAVDTWKGMGYIMVLLSRDCSPFHGIIMKLHPSMVRALFKSCSVLPYLCSPTITIATVLNITYGLRVFDAVYVLTNGGPGNATDVINTAVYSSFAKGYWGLGSALSTILFVIMAIISFFIIRLMNRKVEY